VRTLGWPTQSYKQQNKAENVLRNPSGMFSPEDKVQWSSRDCLWMDRCGQCYIFSLSCKPPYISVRDLCS